MTARISLIRSETVRQDREYLKVFVCRVDVGEMEGLPDSRVFVFQRTPYDPHLGDTKDEFVTVASPVDMYEYLAEDPPVDGSTPFFRKSFVEVYLRAQAEVEEFWQLIQSEVCTLVEAFNTVGDLAVAETIWCPSPPDTSDSSDSSGSSDNSDSSSESA